MKTLLKMQRSHQRSLPGLQVVKACVESQEIYIIEKEKRS